MSGLPKRDFEVCIPARFLKDPTISGDAKLLRTVIGAFADGKTGCSYVQPKRLEKILRWGRRRREKAQKELAETCWLYLGWKRGAHGEWTRRTYRVCDPSTVAHFERSGGTAQLISHHSQSQVRSSVTTSLTETQIPENTPSSRVT